MKTTSLALLMLVAAIPACAQTLLGVESNDARGPAVAAAARTAPDAATARTAFDAFLAVYLDGGQGIIRKTEPDHTPRPQPNNPWEWIADKADRVRDWAVEQAAESIRLQKADYWWVPHFIEMAADSYELTGDARDRDFAKGQNDRLFSVFYYWWANSFNDDLGWHMLAALRMYEVTQEKQWLDDGKKLHARIREYYDGTYGGGVWWKRDGTRFKNVPINAPYVIASMKLFKLTGEDRYKKDAVEVYTWMESKLFHKPVVEDGINDTGLVSSAYTYNYGTFVGASVAMYDETGDARYWENAVSAADHAIATLAPGGIVKDEGSGDGAGFKMIFTRYLVDLAARPGGTKYLEFLDKNAAAAWANRRQADNIMGYDWSKPAPASDIQSFTAASGVDIILQARLAHKRLGR